MTLQSGKQNEVPAQLHGWTEQQLVEAAKVDMEAFGKLYDLHFSRIYSYAYYRTRSHAEAEDVTAQTFQQALEHMGRYEWRGVPFAAWLYRIASNAIVGRYRSRPVQVKLEEAYHLASREPLPEEASLRREMGRQLMEAVAGLPPSQQQAVVLKFSQGLRNREIGEIMDCSEGAVKQLLHRAMEKLRGRVER